MTMVSREKRYKMILSRLQSVMHTSTLMAGFGMMALVELQLNAESKVPAPLLLSFVVCTCLLIAVNIVALLITTCLFPYLHSSKTLKKDVFCGDAGMQEFGENDMIDKFRCFIETAWLLSNVIGMLLFLVNVTLICWLKFYDTQSGTVVGITATVISVSVLWLIAFVAVLLHRKVISYHVGTTTTVVNMMEDDFSKIRYYP